MQRWTWLFRPLNKHYIKLTNMTDRIMTNISRKAKHHIAHCYELRRFWYLGVLPTQMSFFHQFWINWLSYVLRVNDIQAFDFLTKTCSAARINTKAYPSILVQISRGRVAYISSQIFGYSLFWGGRQCSNSFLKWWQQNRVWSWVACSCQHIKHLQWFISPDFDEVFLDLN